MSSVDDTQKLGDGVGGQSRSNRGEHIKGVVSVGKLRVADGRGTRVTQRPAKGLRLNAGNHRIALAVQHEKWRRLVVHMRNRRRQFEKFGLVGVTLFHDEKLEERHHHLVHFLGIGEVVDVALGYVYCMEQTYGTGIVLKVDGGTVLV